MSLDELLSSLRDIASRAPPYSELYGCALAIKAFSELYHVSNPDQREELFKIIDTCFSGGLREIEKRLMRASEKSLLTNAVFRVVLLLAYEFSSLCC